MKKERMYHSIRLLLCRNHIHRAKYLKERKLLADIGENCSWGPWLLPLYTKLIKLHDNVYVHKTAKLIPHDMINRFLAKSNPDKDFGARERIGCIEIMDNVYVGMNVTILPDVRINRNCIISAGSVVTNDIPENSIVAGNPAKIIGSFDKYVAARLLYKDDNMQFKNQELPNELAEEKWIQFNSLRIKNDTTNVCGIMDNKTDANEEIKVIEDIILGVLSENMDGIDFEQEIFLVDQHILDSLGLITVVSLLEDCFKCKIPFGLISAHNFNNIHNMAIMISELPSILPIENNVVESKQLPELEMLEFDFEETEKTVVQRIFDYAVSNPNDVAIIANERITKYQDIVNMIYSVYKWFKAKGVREGDCVTIQAIHEAVCIACYYAVHLLGAKLVPVEKTATEARILEIATETKSVMVISLFENDSLDLNWCNYDTVRIVSCKDKFDKSADIKYPHIDSPCEMIFTTGTTGKSKGVLMTHRHMSWYAYSVAKRIQLKKGNRLLLTTPLNHAGGLRRTHLMLANGCCMVYMDGMSDLTKYFSYIEKYKVTSLYLPPVAIRILITRAEEQLSRYKNQIDFVYSSSSPLPLGDCEKLKEMLPYTRLYNAYEASETPGVSAYDYNSEDTIKDCLGRANEGVELAILSDKNIITKEPEVQGQICVKSKMNMKEYYLEQELTESVYKDGWFVSNDLGYLDNSGKIYYCGRKGDVINIGGYKIAPTDVEEVALLSGMISECICIQEMDEFGVPYIKLNVVVLDNMMFDVKQLNAFLMNHLENYKVPRKIEIVDGIAKTFNGKIDRKAYRK